MVSGGHSGRCATPVRRGVSGSACPEHAPGEGLAGDCCLSHSRARRPAPGVRQLRTRALAVSQLPVAPLSAMRHPRQGCLAAGPAVGGVAGALRPHLVFTLPQGLNGLYGMHPRWVIDTLFACVAQTLKEFAPTTGGWVTPAAPPRSAWCCTLARRTCSATSICTL